MAEQPAATSGSDGAFAPWPARAIHQVPYRREVAPVLTLAGLRRLKDQGNAPQPRMVDETAERLKPDVPLADVPVTVHARLERHLRVVEMDQLEPPQSHHP